VFSSNVILVALAVVSCKLAWISSTNCLAAVFFIVFVYSIPNFLACALAVSSLCTKLSYVFNIAPSKLEDVWGFCASFADNWEINVCLSASCLASSSAGNCMIEFVSFKSIFISSFNILLFSVIV
jgi:hypothetical protein